MFKKLLITLPLLFLVTPSFAAYQEVDCSSDPSFAANSCGAIDKCFNGGDKVQGDNLGLLTDLWMNITDIPKILYKEEQVDPEMINLDPENVSWIQTPGSDNFWEYTDEFNALYSDDQAGYVLNPGNSVTWIKSALSSAFKLETNSAVKGTNIGLLVYSISTHNILADGEVTIDNTETRECVLFKSGDAAAVKVIEKPRKLPQTGPAEYILLIFLAMILGFGFLHFRNRA